MAKRTKKAPEIKFADPLNWTPRPHRGHPRQCPCYQCEALAKWTKRYMREVNGR